MNAHLSLVSSTVSSPVSCPVSRHSPGAKELQLRQRIFLYPSELYRIPPIYRQIRADQGTAYISQGGKDFVVSTNEWVKLERSTDVALVSPLRSEILILELFA